MRRRTGKRSRAMVDISRWCRKQGCRLLPAHRGMCDVVTDQDVPRPQTNTAPNPPAVDR